MSISKIIANIPTLIAPDRESNHDMRIGGKKVGPKLSVQTKKINGKRISFLVKKVGPK